MSDIHIQGPQIHQFNNVATNKIPRSSFNRSFPYRTTFNPNYLIPVFTDEILPGDDFNIKMNALVRLSTPVKPIMDNMYLETFWFFVPNRLVWTNWKKLQGEQINPGDSVAYTVPVLDKTVAPMSTTGFIEQSIFDYMELPTKVTGLSNISALYNRAYDLIWNEWFRDENLDNSLTVATGDGPDAASIYALRVRRKRKDYFTSALPSPQKGTAVSIGLTGNLRIQHDAAVGGTLAVWAANAPGYRVMDASNANLQASNTVGAQGNALYGDLSTVSAITINALRQAALYQQILELDARAGTRYVESLYSRFGVISPDFRLQRPELIGQSSSRFNIYSVPQTAPTVTGQTPQGNLAAFGTNIISGTHGCHYSATEHGMIIGLMEARADLTYQQGIPRRYTRQTRLDFYEPLLNGLGEQTITNGEIYAQGTSADADPFGYAERFSEYRYRNAAITGYFRSNATGTLDVWHLSQQLGALPVLNSSFIAEAMPIDRVLAVATSVAPAFLFDAHFDFTHVRPMPIRSNPGITRL